MHKISSFAPILGAPFLLPAVLVDDIAPGLRATSRAVLGEVRGFLGFLGLDPVPLLPARRRLAERSAVPLAGPSPLAGPLPDRVRLHLGVDRPAQDRAQLRSALAPAFQPLVDATCGDGTVVWQAKFAHRASAMPYLRQVVQVKLLDTLFHQLHVHEPERVGAKLAARLSPAARALLQGSCRTAEEAATLMCEALAELPVPAGRDADAHGALSTDMPALWRGFGGVPLRVAGVEGDADPGLQARVAAVHQSLCEALAPLFDKA